MFDKLFESLSAFERATGELRLPTPVPYASLKGHSGMVRALALGTDGRLYSGSSDNTIKVWDVSSGACVRTLAGHSDWVHVLALGSDGRLYSGSHDRTIKVWDVSSGACERTLAGHSRWVLALALGSDGRLYSGSWDKTIKVWDVSSGACVRTLAGHSGGVLALALGTDGRLYSGSADETIKVWDLSSGACVRTLKGHSDLVHALALGSGGRLYSGSGDNTIKVWDESSGACVRTLEGHSNSVHALALGTDGRLYSGSRDNTIKVWDVSSGACERTLAGHSDYVQALALGTDGRLYSGSWDKTIKVWDEGVSLRPALSGILSALKGLEDGLKSEQLQGGALSGLPQTQLQSIKRFESVLETTLAVLACKSVSGFERTSSLDEARQNVLQVLDGVANAVPAFRNVLGEIEKSKKAVKPAFALVSPSLAKKAVHAPSAQKSVSSQLVSKPKPKAAPKKSLARMRCTEDYPNEGDDSYLNLHEGDLIEIVKSFDEEWYVARLKGKEGFAPKNLLVAVSKETSSSGLSSSPYQSVGSHSTPQHSATQSKSTIKTSHSGDNVKAPSPSKVGSQLSQHYDVIPHADLVPYQVGDKALAPDVNPLLGAGGFGEVRLARWVPHRLDVAVKYLHAKQLSKPALEELKKEAGMMAQLRSPFVVQLYGLTLSQTPYGLVMEYCARGSLHNLLHSDQAITWTARQRIAIDLASGLTYLHHKKILHRDLKSQNVLLDDKGKAKLCDFGLSKVRTESTQATTRWVGTISYSAPETLDDEHPRYLKASDVFSLGLLLWEMIARKLPYENAKGNHAKTMAWIMMGKRPAFPGIRIPDTLKTVTQQAWHASPEQRGTAHDLADTLEDSLSEAEALDAELAPPEEIIEDTPQPWHYDRSARPDLPQAQQHQLFSASRKDIHRVFEWYRQHPMKNKTLHSVTVIDNPGMNRKFALQLNETQNRAYQPAFQPQWKQHGVGTQPHKRRQAIQRQLNLQARPYEMDDHPDVKLLPLWHGTKSPAVIESVCQTGYANLATTDDGYFGKGIYNAAEAEYSARVYGGGTLLLLNWVAFYSAFPVIREDMPKLTGKANYGNYDAHYVPVVPQDPNDPHEVSYLACRAGQKPRYTEVVVFNPAQCLPRYIIELKPSTPGLPHLPDKTQEEKAVYGQLFQGQQAVNQAPGAAHAKPAPKAQAKPMPVC